MWLFDVESEIFVRMNLVLSNDSPLQYMGDTYALEDSIVFLA